MEKSNFFALMSRMKYISRWGLMRNTVPENIKEHSLDVAMIAHALAVIRRDIFNAPADPGLCAAAAVFHDASEILTGDMPTPVKYGSADIRTAYKTVERDSAARLLNMLPPSLRTSYEKLLLPDERSYVHSIVKSADTIAAYVKCCEELKSGNGEFKKASEQIFSKLEKIELPEVKYFLDAFLDGYLLTLDEL